jgi:Phage terminase large subunit (GpA)
MPAHTPVSPPSTHPAENERRLSRGRSIRFSDSLEPVWFERLCSERKVLRYVRGLPVRRFERKPGAKAEALDCLVYAFTARQRTNCASSGRRNPCRASSGRLEWRVEFESWAFHAIAFSFQEASRLEPFDKNCRVSPATRAIENQSTALSEPVSRLTYERADMLASAL